MSSTPYLLAKFAIHCIFLLAKVDKNSIHIYLHKLKLRSSIHENWQDTGNFPSGTKVPVPQSQHTNTHQQACILGRRPILYFRESARIQPLKRCIVLIGAHFEIHHVLFTASKKHYTLPPVPQRRRPAPGVFYVYGCVATHSEYSN